MENSESNSCQEKVDKTADKFFDRFVSFILISFDLIRSILIRICFSIHIAVAVVFVALVKNDTWYLVNLVGIAFIAIEWFFCALKNGGIFFITIIFLTQINILFY